MRKEIVAYITPFYTGLFNQVSRLAYEDNLFQEQCKTARDMFEKAANPENAAIAVQAAGQILAIHEADLKDNQAFYTAYQRSQQPVSDTDFATLVITYGSESARVAIETYKERVKVPAMDLV